MQSVNKYVKRSLPLGNCKLKIQKDAIAHYWNDKSETINNDHENVLSSYRLSSLDIHLRCQVKHCFEHKHIQFGI